MPPKARERLERRHVYAVIRLDKFQDQLEDAVTVKEILPSEQQALAEVKRLNNLRRERGEGDDVVYLSQVTRFFPQGLGDYGEEP